MAMGRGVAWCPVVWRLVGGCGAKRGGVVWCGAVVRRGVACCGVMWLGVVWCGALWRGVCGVAMRGAGVTSRSGVCVCACGGGGRGGACGGLVLVALAVQETG